MFNKPHKHAELIKAWADGAQIQFRWPGLEKSEWKDIVRPMWREDFEYRVKPQPHKWQKEMDAYYKDKKDIQCRYVGNVGWITWSGKAAPLREIGNLFDDPLYEFRIKPEVVERFLFAVQFNGTGDFNMTSHKKEKDNLKLTFEDGKLVKAEVI